MDIAQVLNALLSSGNAVGLTLFSICYLIIYFQRKSTGEKRNKVEDELRLQIKLANDKAEAAELAAQRKIEEAVEEMQEEINTLKTERLLMAKDIEVLKNDVGGVKEDVKEIKLTLSNIAVSIAELAAAAKVRNEEKQG